MIEADIYFMNKTVNETMYIPHVKIGSGYVRRTITEPYKIITITICSFIIVFSILGNVTLSATIIHKKKLRSATNLLLLSLVAADLLTAVVFIPMYLERFLHQELNHSNEKICLIRKYMYITTSSGSLISLAAISFDRMLAISNPFRYERWMTKRAACLTIGVIWFWTICFNSITFHTFLDWGPVLSTCVAGIPQTLFLIVTPIGFYLPGVIIIAVYVKIYLVARTLNKKIAVSKVSVSSSQLYMTDLSCSSVHSCPSTPTAADPLKRRRSSLPELVSNALPHSTSPEKDRRPRSSTTLTVLSSPLLTKARSSTLISQTLHGGREKLRKVTRSITRDIRTVKTIAMLVGLFLLCWLPTAGFHVYINAVGTEAFGNQDLLYLYEIFTLMSFVNCALDPYLYTFRNVELRKATQTALNGLLQTFKGTSFK